MRSLTFGLVLVGFCVVAAPAQAQTQAEAPPPPPVQEVIRRYKPPSRFSKLMLPFYGATAVTQGLDIHSTLRAMDVGAVEANPLLANLSKNRPAFIAVKIGVAAAVLFGANRIAKKSKTAAIISLVGINIGYALIVRHNYRTIQAARAGR